MKLIKIDFFCGVSGTPPFDCAPPVPGSNVFSIIHPSGRAMCFVCVAISCACFTAVLFLPLGILLMEPVEPWFLRVPHTYSPR